MQAFRRLRSLHLLALLALFAQLLLPMQHAASMAHASGDPLQVAFCGKASPQSLALLQASAPQELKQALNHKAVQEQAEEPVQTPCGFCASLAGLSLAALAPSSLPQWEATASTLPAPTSSTAVPRTRLAYARSSRGPPLYT